jgi:pimeloyl-ACP methyl ester carboxylesterase
VPVDYHDLNANAFDDTEIRRRLVNAITKGLDKIHAQKLAAQKVDVVAHSMGGLVVRSFCADKPDECKRNIRKMITIDTPHRGSELADWLLVYRDQRKKQFPNPGIYPLSCHNRISLFVNGSKLLKTPPHPIDRGAVDDLATGLLPDRLAGARNNHQPPTPWAQLPSLTDTMDSHLVLGATRMFRHADIQSLWEQVLIPCGFTRAGVFGGSDDQDDGIVSKESQSNGFEGDGFSSVVEDHISVLQSAETVKEVLQVLEAQ